MSLLWFLSVRLEMRVTSSKQRTARNASNGSANAGLAKSQREYFERDNTDHKASVFVIEK